MYIWKQLDFHITIVAYTLDVVRAVLSCGLNRNVIVLLKVNPSVAARKQLTIEQKTRRERADEPGAEFSTNMHT